MLHQPMPKKKAGFENPNTRTVFFATKKSRKWNLQLSMNNAVLTPLLLSDAPFIRKKKPEVSKRHYSSKAVDLGSNFRGSVPFFETCLNLGQTFHTIFKICMVISTQKFNQTVHTFFYFMKICEIIFKIHLKFTFQWASWNLQIVSFY